MKGIPGIIVACSIGLASVVDASEIHKCTDEFGNTMYSQTPCAKAPAAVEKPVAAEEAAVPNEQHEIDDDIFESVEPVNEVRDEATVAACQEHYRSELDRIFEMLGNGVTTDESQQLREEALALSRALRAC